MSERLLTSESVTEGHPDKLADRISDAVLDAVLAADPAGRVACETLVTRGLVVLAGEVRTGASVDREAAAREAIRDVGYLAPEDGLAADGCAVLDLIGAQSPEIASAVDRSAEARAGAGGDPRELLGAGDQGLVYGYASDETPELMPLPIVLAHALCARLSELRRERALPLRPDGKSQVTVRYAGGEPRDVVAVVLSAQHAPELGLDELRAELIERAVRPVLERSGRWRTGIDLHVNPGGPFTLGGPAADAGLTGRKLNVDAYGGLARVGGGAFSGKDPSKVDRSGAYAARRVARWVVVEGLARRCEVQIAYAIGVARPLALALECFGTERRELARIERAARERFDLRPGAIVEELDLLRPIYRQTSAYGHFGRRGPAFSWER